MVWCTDMPGHARSHDIIWYHSETSVNSSPFLRHLRWGTVNAEVTGIETDLLQILGDRFEMKRIYVRCKDSNSKGPPWSDGEVVPLVLANQAMGRSVGSYKDHIRFMACFHMFSKLMIKKAIQRIQNDHVFGISCTSCLRGVPSSIEVGQLPKTHCAQGKRMGISGFKKHASVSGHPVQFHATFEDMFWAALSAGASNSMRSCSGIFSGTRILAPLLNWRSDKDSCWMLCWASLCTWAEHQQVGHCQGCRVWERKSQPTLKIKPPLSLRSLRRSKRLSLSFLRICQLWAALEARQRLQRNSNFQRSGLWRMEPSTTHRAPFQS